MDASTSTLGAGRHRRRRTGKLALALLVPLLALFAPTAASASTTQIVLTERAEYSCTGPCATATNFTVDGQAHPVTGRLGEMSVSAAGTVLGVNDAGCLLQSEQWTFSKKGHGRNDAFNLSTTSDTFCPTADPNLFIETASFVIDGGTGRFSGASGTGAFSLAVLVDPQVSTGWLTATITS